ncbi:MAG: CHAT domain-containing protein, partial [Acidimicrobiales bacterium]
AVARGSTDDALEILGESFAKLSAHIELFGAIDAASQASAAVARLIDQAKLLTAPTQATQEFVLWTDRGRQIATWRWPRVDDPELQTLLNRARAVISETESADPEEAKQAHNDLSRLKSEIRSRRWSRPADKTTPASPTPRRQSQPGPHLDLTQVDGSWYLATNSEHSGHWPVEIDNDEIAALTRLGRLMHTAPESSRDGIWARVEQAIATLNELIESALAPSSQTLTIGIDESLSGVPWSALPSLWGRAYSILPTRKLVGNARHFHRDRTDTISLLGPGLIEPDQMIRDAGSDPVSAETIEQVWEALEHRVVQISAHGGPEPKNPLFGWLDLGCGKVLLHDLMFLEKVPEIVILAACFSARTESMGSGGTISFANGFLALGTRWVVAASGTLSDTQDLRRFSDAVLRLVASGEDAPVALANARQMSGARGQSLAALTFTCFGG